jgi:lipopolysaccharide/colanic/teichoic acid biosynthesis glycosyltransferase
MLKRLFDVIFSLFGLIITFPILGTIVLLIKLDSKGPVFYRGTRIGKNGKPFKIFKFRTMVPNAEKAGGPSTALNDPRLTKIGKLLRTYKLDELPQLINILKGEMSFVGPRPQVKKYVQLYNEEEKIILTVRPGMTDYATIRYIYLDKVLGDRDVDELYLKKIEPEKNKLRIKYAKHHSPSADVKIIFQTILAIIKIIILKKK